MLVFEKNPDPITVEEKYKLKLVGSFCVNEEVKAAAFGSLRHARNDSQAMSGEANLKKRTSYAKENRGADDVEMA
jgi:hypothetical protein